MASTGLAACGLPSGERLLDGSEVAGTVQRELQIPLAKIEPVESTAVLANVRDVYTRAVFQRDGDDRRLQQRRGDGAARIATAERTRPEPSQVTRDNIVVLYRHEPGTISRFRELRTALAHVGPPA